MLVHKRYLLVDVVVFCPDWAASGGALCVFGWQDDEPEGGRWWERADIGDTGAGFEERDIGRRIHMSVDVDDGGFGRHSGDGKLSNFKGDPREGLDKRSRSRTVERRNEGLLKLLNGFRLAAIPCLGIALPFVDS